MLMAIASVGLTACGDNKDEPRSIDYGIIGTWQMDTTIYYDSYLAFIQFTEDGNFNDAEIWTYPDSTTIDVYTGTYTLSRDVVKITETDKYHYKTSDDISDIANLDNARFDMISVTTGEKETYSMNYLVQEKQLIVSVKEDSVTLTKANNSDIEKYLKLIEMIQLD